MMPSKPLSSSSEDYLEAIFHIVSEKQVAQAKDIAKRMNVKQSSVTSALQTLKKQDLINYVPYEYVTLTPLGMERAETIIHRHRVLQSFFTDILEIENDEASETACKIEHQISDRILQQLTGLLGFFKKCPIFTGHIGCRRQTCRICLKEAQERLKPGSRLE